MIYLIRHGLDDERFIGGYSNVELTKEGIEQVHESGIWLKENVKNIDKIYTSDIKRAIQSADIINGYFNLEVEKIDCLRELNKGLLNGMDKELAKIYYPDYIEVNNINIKYPDGESMIDLYNRIKKILYNIDVFDNCLLVTHRGVINMLYVLLNDEDLTMDKEKYGVVHASIHELDKINKKIRRIR